MPTVILGRPPPDDVLHMHGGSATCPIETPIAVLPSSIKDPTRVAKPIHCIASSFYFNLRSRAPTKLIFSGTGRWQILITSALLHFRVALVFCVCVCV